MKPSTQQRYGITSNCIPDNLINLVMYLPMENDDVKKHISRLVAYLVQREHIVNLIRNRICLIDRRSNTLTVHDDIYIDCIINTPVYGEYISRVSAHVYINLCPYIFDFPFNGEILRVPHFFISNNISREEKEEEEEDNLPMTNLFRFFCTVILVCIYVMGILDLCTVAEGIGIILICMTLVLASCFYYILFIK